MGRKQKIIPHIPGTLDSIVEAIFANDKHIRKKKREESNEGKEKEKADTKTSQK